MTFFVPKELNHSRGMLPMSETPNNNYISLNIYLQNLCGVGNKKEELEIYLQDFHLDNLYVCITEHFLTIESAPQFNVSNYKMVSLNTRKNKKRGGSLIMARNDIVCEEVPFCQKIYKIESFEICGVKDVSTNIYIFCCYRNPMDQNYETFLSKLEQLLEHFFNKKCIICGDFNIDLLKSDKKTSNFLTLLTSYNFRPIINEVTYKRNHVWIIF